MHTPSNSLAPLDDRRVDPWAFLAADSVGIVIGFGVDLVRLGVYSARQGLTGRSNGQRVATPGWPCPGPCDAGAR